MSKIYDCLDFLCFVLNCTNIVVFSSDILRRCIVEQIAKMMVLPNKLPIKLSDEVPTVDLRMPEPEVHLLITYVCVLIVLRYYLTFLFFFLGCSSYSPCKGAESYEKGRVDAW